MLIPTALFRRMKHSQIISKRMPGVSTIYGYRGIPWLMIHAFSVLEEGNREHGIPFTTTTPWKTVKVGGASVDLQTCPIQLINPYFVNLDGSTTDNTSSSVDASRIARLLNSMDQSIWALQDGRQSCIFSINLPFIVKRKATRTPTDAFTIADLLLSVVALILILCNTHVCQMCVNIPLV